MEIIFLTNDVGSLAKDKKKGNQNVVFSLAHHYPGTAVKDAVDVVVSMIEHKVDEFFEVGNKLPLVEADFLWYFELLKKVIRSNWSCQVPSPCLLFFLLSHTSSSQPPPPKKKTRLTASFSHEVEETL